jgi:isopenicillin N synthase-like dioxygenase
MSGANFTSVPILDYSLLSSPSTKPQFISQLRSALINVGFLYLSHPPVDPSGLISYIPRLFALPQDVKDSLRMANSPHFLGYSRFGAELTKGETDLREQWDIATQHDTRWKEGEPIYYRLWGASQVSAFAQFRSMRLIEYAVAGRGSDPWFQSDDAAISA